MSNIVIGANGEKMLSLTGSPHVDYKTIVSNASSLNLEQNAAQVVITNDFSQVVKNALSSKKGVNIEIAAKNFNALSLSNQMNESVDALMQSANSFINDENSTSIDNVNHHATKLDALKDFTEAQITPLIEADYQKQQENARSQPLPKFLDKK